LRGQHLSKYAAQAGGRRKGKRKGRLNPREYQARSGHKGAAAVVLLLAHKGVLRPSEWLSLIRGGDVTLVIYSNVQLPPTLQPFHFPLEHVTAWEDFTLFAVLRDMLRYVLSALSDASNATNATVVCRAAESWRTTPLDSDNVARAQARGPSPPGDPWFIPGLVHRHGVMPS
jgi:hypothetical protein